VYRTKKLKKRPRSRKGCRAAIIIIIILIIIIIIRRMQGPAGKHDGL
jgi:hypothetical protein